MKRYMSTYQEFIVAAILIGIVCANALVKQAKADVCPSDPVMFISTPIVNWPEALKLAEDAMFRCFAEQSSAMALPDDEDKPLPYKWGGKLPLGEGWPR